MAQPQENPHAAAIRLVAVRTLIAGIAIMFMKLGVFWLTNSAAVLSDALESIINIVAAAVMCYSVWLSNRPPDSEHPYGHGKVEFMTLGLEGWMILIAGVVIAWVALQRFISGAAPANLEWGTWLLIGVNVCNGTLAAYVFWAGRKYQSPVLVADAKHLMTDVGSTLGVVVGLVLVQVTQQAWLDPLVAILMAGLILWTSWHILWQAINGLMDRSDPGDHAAICAILDDEVKAGAIRGYHKVRHRHTGQFHWVEMHLQVEPTLTVKQGHELASRVEYRIEQTLGQAKATAHIEPFEPAPAAPAPPATGQPA